jgi:hypothetical protein
MRKGRTIVYYRPRCQANQRAMSFLTEGVRRVRWYASPVLRTASAWVG